jgi:putative salt-induced outer membrane protein YdiY
MFKTKKILALMAGLQLMLAAPLQADVITFDNGDQITGTIKQFWDDEISIEPDYADEFKVEISAVAYVRSDREFELEFEDGREVVATFPGADSAGNQLISVEGQTTVFEFESLLKLDEPEDRFDWSNNVQLSAAINKGNTDTENVRLFADGMVKLGDHRHLADLTITREEQSGVTSREQDLFRYGYNWLFNDPWFFAGGFSAERDPIRDLDYRYIVSAGIGRDIWNQPRKQLNFTLGVGYSTEELGIVETDEAVAIWRLRYRHDLLSDLDIFHNQEIIIGQSNTFVKTSTGVNYEISDLLYASFSVDFDYESDPALGAENEDLALLLGFGLEFE